MHDCKELRAFAAGGCGPLRFLTGTANSAFKIQNYGIGS